MIQDALLRTIQKFRMIEKGETLFVAVSGGCDSTVLLHLLHEMAASWKLKLATLHVNHQLRGKASDQDEAFVRKLAQKYKIPFFTTKVSIKKLAHRQKMSLEEAARAVRYEFFERILKTKHAQKLVMAHSQDDQAETVLMRIMNGTGLQGLQAIRPKRKLNGADLIRPLIEVSRREIRAYAKVNKIKFREDKTNRELQFVRNKIRLKLIPFMEENFNPQVKKALARLPHLLDVDLSFLDETAETFFHRYAVVNKNENISFPKQSFLELKPSIQYRLLERALSKLGKAELNFDHWNRFSELLMEKRQFKFQFPKKLIAAVTPNQIKIKYARQTPISFFYSLNLGESVYMSEIDMTLSCEKVNNGHPQGGAPTHVPSNDDWLDALKKTDPSFDIFDRALLKFPLTIRSRKAGDRFQPLGQQKRSKLKSFLINKGIPVEDRDCLPIVLSNHQIAWVSGVAMGEPFKINSKTRQFVRLALTQGAIHSAVGGM